MHIACEELNFVWSERDVIKFRKLWFRGVDIWNMAVELNRDVDEIAILAIDQARAGKIQARKKGVFG